MAWKRFHHSTIRPSGKKGVTVRTWIFVSLAEGCDMMGKEMERGIDSVCSVPEKDLCRSK